MRSCHRPCAPAVAARMDMLRCCTPQHTLLGKGCLVLCARACRCHCTSNPRRTVQKGAYACSLFVHQQLACPLPCLPYPSQGLDPKTWALQQGGWLCPTGNRLRNFWRRWRCWWQPRRASFMSMQCVTCVRRMGPHARSSRSHSCCARTANVGEALGSARSFMGFRGCAR